MLLSLLLCKGLLLSLLLSKGLLLSLLLSKGLLLSLLLCLSLLLSHYSRHGGLLLLLSSVERLSMSGTNRGSTLRSGLLCHLLLNRSDRRSLLSSSIVNCKPLSAGNSCPAC